MVQVRKVSEEKLFLQVLQSMMSHVGTGAGGVSVRKGVRGQMTHFVRSAASRIEGVTCTVQSLWVLRW